MACSSCGKSHAKKAGMAPSPATRQSYSGRRTFSAAASSAHGSPKVRLSFGRGR